jgi:hypothetical protein
VDNKQPAKCGEHCGTEERITPRFATIVKANHSLSFKLDAQVAAILWCRALAQAATARL